jgi:hypothetical protein
MMILYLLLLIIHGSLTTLSTQPQKQVTFYLNLTSFFLSHELYTGISYFIV